MGRGGATMTFICAICDTEHSEDKRSYDDICIYCDTTIIDDVTKDDSQSF